MEDVEEGEGESCWGGEEGRTVTMKEERKRVTI